MTEFHLHPYQREALEKLAHRHITALPTGTGKTVVFCAAIAKSVREHSQAHVVLVHREELIPQTEKALRKVGYPGPIGVVQGTRQQWHQPVIVAMQQTVRRVLDRIPPTCMLIVDEAHRYTTQLSGHSVLARFEDAGAQIYGFTATPQINNEEIFGAGKPFLGISYRRTILGMIREGYLCDARAMTLKLGFDLRRVKVSKGDYVASALDAAMTKVHAPSRIVEAWEEHAHSRARTMVFTPTVKLGEMVREAFEAKGHHAVSVYGHTPAPIRAANIHDFRSGSVPILVNVIVGAEGFDVPEVDCIIQARPTKSWTLYTQMVGRGLRTALGKKDLLVLDVVGAADVHDLNMFPKVVGLRKLAPFESVLEKVEDEFGEKSEQELELHDQKIELEETLLYSPIAWTAYGQEWLAPCDEERLVVLSCEPAGPDDAQPIWMAHVHWVNQSGREELILEHEDRAVVQEHADDYIREYGDVALVQRRRSWRQGAPSEKQARFLSHYRWKVPETRGEASDAITRLRYAINRKKAGV